MLNLAHLGSGLDSDAQRAISAMTIKPDSTRSRLISNLVSGLKQDGVWPLLDWLCLLAAHDAQAGLVNIRNPVKIMTAANSPTFTADRGYTGDAISMHLDWGEKFNAPGNLFSLNSCTLGAWCNQQGAGTAASAHIGVTGGTAVYVLNAIGTTGAETYRISDSSSDTARTGTSTRTGHRAMIRTGAAVKRSFYNGVRTSDLTSASTTVSTANGTALRSSTAYSPDRLAAVYSGGGLSDTQAGALHDRLNIYLTAIGAQ